MCYILFHHHIFFLNFKNTQPARNVPGTSLEGLLNVVTSETSKGPSEDSLGTNTKIDNLMKKNVFRCNSPCFTHFSCSFYWKNKYSEDLNGDVHGTYTGPSCRTSRGTNDATGDVRGTSVIDVFLNSTHKHIELTLTGYSKLSSELQ